MLTRSPLVFSLLLSACAGGSVTIDTDAGSTDDDTDVPDIEYPDRDGDGSTADEDCDDQNPLVNPDQDEVCNGADDDCDGLSDAVSEARDGFTAAYQDDDIDAYGGASSQRWFCTVPSGWTLQGGDCDDDNAARNPGAIEVCNGVDDDCDSAADDDDDSLVAAGHPTAVQRFPDADGDTFGLGTQRWYCTEPASGTAPNGTDCDDNDRFAFPGSAERESSTSCRRDADGDGYGSSAVTGGVVAGGDCDDTSAATFPGSAERESSSSCRLDADGDGYGSKTTPAGVTVGTDCADGIAAVNPGASEVWYDGTDANCDGRDDWDQDNDGAAAPSKPGGGTDCNDTNGAVRPSATEVCNGIDDDCDVAIDDSDPNVSVTAPWYVDNDNDGYAGTVVRTCAQPVGGVGTGPDCDDTRNTTFPGAAERESSTSCRADADGDGYGDALAPSPVVRGGDCDDTANVTFPGSAEKESSSSCRTDADGDGFGAKTPAANVTAGGDCNDGSTAIRPDATETWYDGTDQNCDARDDWDQDGDGAAATSKPGGGADCVDTDAAIKPGATEVCDTIDNDCDTLVDDADGGVSVTVFWYVDTDGDGFAGSANPVRTCSQPPGGVRLAAATDCDDTKLTTFPGAAERESGTACRADADGDGYGSTSAPSGGTAGTDCDDSTAATFPGSAERESSTSCRLDADGDGYGASVKPPAVTGGGDCDDTKATTFPGAAQAESSSACRADADDDGYGSTTAPNLGTAGADCNDASAAVKPGAAEIWYDGVDQNCDGGNDWDQDADGFDAVAAVDGDDCDDTRASVNPNALEVCDSLDNDCDIAVDDADDDTVLQPWGEDLDGDGFPGADTLYDGCAQPAPDLIRLDGTNEDCDDDDDRTYVGAAYEESATLCMTDADEDGWGSDLPLAGIDIGNDCDDLDADVNPDAFEVWYDGVDQDCDVSTEWDQDGDGVPKVGAPGGGTDCDDTTTTLGSSTLDTDCDGTVNTADCNPTDASKQCVVQQIAGGYDHTCAVFDGGRVRCWGNGGQGRLGYGVTTTVGDNETPYSYGDVPVGASVKQIAAGLGHTCALRTDGSVSCWGYNAYGELGYGYTNDIGDNEPASAAGTVNIGATVSQITAGTYHTCVLTTAGAVKCWGRNEFGQLGYGNVTTIGDNETPSSVGTVSIGAGTVQQLVAGGSHTCVLFTDGTVRCWGAGNGGRLGYGNTNHIGDNELPSSVGKVSISSTSTVTQLAIGGAHTCARMADMSVRCWGFNGSGQLGRANTTTIGDNELPSSVDVSGAVFDVVSVSAGENHTCVLRASGGVRCWGYAMEGQLGYGNTNNLGDNEVPSGTVNTGVNARYLMSGGIHNCVIGEGSLEPVRCWGWGLFGQLGYASTSTIGDTEHPSSAGSVTFR